MCVLEAMAEVEEIFPERVHNGKENQLPLFRLASGKPILRTQVQRLLEISAIGIGVEPGKMGSHSLRIGGATAMYHALGDLGTVRRFGRWASDCFHGYLWEASELLCVEQKNIFEHVLIPEALLGLVVRVGNAIII